MGKKQEILRLFACFLRENGRGFVSEWAILSANKFFEKNRKNFRKTY
jgi:hypothetical protein